MRMATLYGCSGPDSGRERTTCHSALRLQAEAFCSDASHANFSRDQNHYRSHHNVPTPHTSPALPSSCFRTCQNRQSSLKERMSERSYLKKEVSSLSSFRDEDVCREKRRCPRWTDIVDGVREKRSFSISGLQADALCSETSRRSPSRMPTLCLGAEQLDAFSLQRN